MTPEGSTARPLGKLKSGDVPSKYPSTPPPTIVVDVMLASTAAVMSGREYAFASPVEMDGALLIADAALSMRMAWLLLREGGK